MENWRPHKIYQCLRPECRLRFPVWSASTSNVKCPKCGSPTRLIASSPSFHKSSQINSFFDNFQLEAMLDNIRSAFNVGSIFRSADGVGIKHLYLCGVTPAPGDAKIAKTALGAEFSVSWSLHWNGVEICHMLKEQGKHLWALENSTDAQSLFELTYEPTACPIVLVIGNEVSGVDPDILQECEHSISIPMLGHKNSLNVATAFGIAVYLLRYIYQNQHQAQALRALHHDSA